MSERTRTATESSTTTAGSAEAPRYALNYLSESGDTGSMGVVPGWIIRSAEPDAIAVFALLSEYQHVHGGWPDSAEYVREQSGVRTDERLNEALRNLYEIEAIRDVGSSSGAVAVPHWVIKSFSPNAIAVWSVLLAHENSGAEPASQQQHADALNLSESTFRRAVSELVGGGAIDRVPRYDAERGRLPNGYRFYMEGPAR